MIWISSTFGWILVLPVLECFQAIWCFWVLGHCKNKNCRVICNVVSSWEPLLSVSWCFSPFHIHISQTFWSVMLCEKLKKLSFFSSIPLIYVLSYKLDYKGSCQRHPELKPTWPFLVLCKKFEWKIDYFILIFSRQVLSTQVKTIYS